MCHKVYSLPVGKLECEHKVARPDTSRFHLWTAWGWAWLEPQETLMGWFI